jgi:hypothetical protein
MVVIVSSLLFKRCFFTLDTIKLSLMSAKNAGILIWYTFSFVVFKLLNLAVMFNKINVLLLKEV